MDGRTEALADQEEEGGDLANSKSMPPKMKVTKSSIVTLLILVFINLLNYMDRYTLSGVLTTVQKWFGGISDEKGGLLQTVFICTYMFFAPVFGYLGDRFSRKLVMIFGITIWSVTVFVSSYMGPHQFWWFFVLRGLVGIGEASYSTVAPTIIADLFVGDHRSKALSLFYFAIPCGSALGYIAGSKMSEAMHNKWQWAFRLTPGLGVIAVLLVIVAVREPKRGAIEVLDANEDVDEVSESVTARKHSTLFEDLKKILRVRSFIYATIGNAGISFVVGGVGWWIPKFTYYCEKTLSDDPDSVTPSQVSYKFGVVTFIAGVTGVWLGAEIARRWRKHNMRADALVCAIGVILSAPVFFVALYVADKIMILCWVLIVLGEIFIFLNWAPNADILLYVIPPNCRSTAEAIQITALHVLGDAISPYIIGLISDTYKKGRTGPHIELEQKALLYSLYMAPFVCVVSSLFYFLCSNHLKEDKHKADMEAKKQLSKTPTESILEDFSNLQTSNGTQIPDAYDNSIESEDYDDTSALISDNGNRILDPVA